jgi:hypothetical protein
VGCVLCFCCVVSCVERSIAVCWFIVQFVVCNCVVHGVVFVSYYTDVESSHSLSQTIQ